MNIDVKLVSKEARFKRFKTTNYLFVKDSDISNILCHKCKESLINDNYAYLCGDFNKIWHELCVEDDHVRETFVTQATLKSHRDFLVYIKVLSQEDFDAIQTEPTVLKLT